MENVAINGNEKHPENSNCQRPGSYWENDREQLLVLRRRYGFSVDLSLGKVRQSPDSGPAGAGIPPLKPQ